jgi:galactonate dehydratase
MHSIWEFRELLTHGGPQYVRPDVGLAGGLTQCKKIAAIAESFHAAVITHNYLGPILTAASVHLDTSIPNFITQEYSKSDEAAHNTVYKTVLKREGGHIPVPEAPGLGVELDPELLAAAAHQPRDLPAANPLRDDGSVAYAV